MRKEIQHTANVQTNAFWWLSADTTLEKPEEKDILF